jgi:hypothetical protein
MRRILNLFMVDELPCAFIFIVFFDELLDAGVAFVNNVVEGAPVIIIFSNCRFRCSSTYKIN